LDNITSGFTTVQNISKFWDYAIPALLFVLAGVIQPFVFHKNKLTQGSSARLLKGVSLGFCSAYILYVIGASANISESILSVSLLVVVALLAYVVQKVKLDVPLGLELCVVICALNLKIFTTQGGLFILVLLNFVAIVLFARGKIDFLSAIVSIVIFKKFDFGPYVVNDLFHSSEFMVSYQRGLDELGRWQVFPNIGFLEEAIPNFIVDSVYACSLGSIQISIQDAYSLGLIFLTGGIYYFLEKKWKGVAYALTMLIAVERLTLMLVMYLGLFLSTLKNHRIAWALIGFVPLLMLGLSPSYGAILIFSLALFFLKNKPNIKVLIPTVAIALVCVTLYDDTFVYYLKVYKDWGAVNTAAHGTPMWSAPTFKTILRLVFVFSLSLVIWQLIEKDAFGVYGAIAFFGIGLSLWMYLNYGFTRLDKDTGSRIFPVGLAVFVSLLPYLKRYTKAVPIILCVSFFGASFATPQSIEKIDLLRQSPKMTLDAESQETLNQYLSVSQQLGEKVILFGSHPALVNYIPNAVLPPFSSPWVAIGRLPQEEVVGFLKDNENTPVLIGKSFSSWDQVDVRARSPIIYAYIAQRYRQVEMNGLIVAVPSDVAHSTEFFSGFDIGQGAAYYVKNKNQIKVVAPCESSDSDSAVFKVSNERNYFFAKLKCGVNTIPDVYFSGEHQSVSKRQAH
jgi:hypothetical protein